MNVNRTNDFPAVEPRPDAVPEFLISLPWGNWIAEPRAEQPGKYNKAPRNPITGIKIGANNPANFGTFDQAVSALATGKFSGFGVLLTPGADMVGIDIDNYPATFEAMPAVRAWVKNAQRAGAYCEQSPSGKGLRLFVRGSLPGKGRKVGPLEIYAEGRFLTVTGKSLKGCGKTLIDGQQLIDEYLALLPAEAQRPAPIPMASVMADAEQVEALAKQIADKHSQLWVGDWQGAVTGSGNLAAVGVVSYPSQSEADFAMCGHITREALNSGVRDDQLPDTVMKVFERCGLYREEKHRQVENYAIPKVIADALATRDAAQVQVAMVTQSDTGADLITHEPGDILAGRTYARAKRNKLLWVSAAGKWLNYGGDRWSWCHCGEEMAAAKFVAAKILDHVATLFKADSQNPKHKKLMAFATALQSLKRLEAMITLAKSEEGMTVGHMTQLDSDPWLLGVRNGVVNLKDGGLLSADPTMLITRQAAAAFHDDAQCPKWLTFLDQTFEGDQETIDYLQRALGYSLTGTTTEEALFICFGHGANGKSVFANVISTILGDYAQAAPASLVTARRDGDASPRNDLARLCGARLTSINETQNGDRLDEQVVKMLAGREQISARFLHKEFFDFWPTAKPWLRTNHKPIIVGEDDGIWRRLHLIPFRRKFAEHERDPWLEQKLLEERDGILAWMVRGCLEWKRIGLKPSATVRRESASYRKESDLLGEFLECRTVVEPEAREDQQTLFATWRLWNDANGTRAGSKVSFTRKLAERGYPAVKSNGKHYYAGVKLIAGAA